MWLTIPVNACTCVRQRVLFPPAVMSRLFVVAAVLALSLAAVSVSASGVDRSEAQSRVDALKARVHGGEAAGTQSAAHSESSVSAQLRLGLDAIAQAKQRPPHRKYTRHRPTAERLSHGEH